MRTELGHGVTDGVKVDLTENDSVVAEGNDHALVILSIQSLVLIGGIGLV